MKILKSIGAVVAGFVIVVILSTATDFLVESVGIFPPATQPQDYVTWMYALALAYRLAITVLAGYVTAKLSPDRPMLHVYILAGIGFVMGSLGAIVNWDLAGDAIWYPVMLAILSPFAVWLGGYIKTK